MNKILIQLNMKYYAVVICIFLINSVLGQRQTVVSVDAEKILYMRTESLIGGNIEDLNNQLYGGLYSQLLYGEAFEEDIGVDFIELSDREKLQLWVRRDDRDKPYLCYYEVRIYEGADGQFVLYEDEGDNYNYEKGVYATINFKWNDSQKVLTIGERKGKFPGMLQSRTFRIIIVGDGKGKGMEEDAQASNTVKYYGNTIKIRL